MSGYMFISYYGEKKTFKTLANARKGAISDPANVVNIYTTEGKPVGELYMVRQDDPERNKVYVKVPAFWNYSKGTRSLLDKNGNVKYTYSRGAYF